MKGRVTLAIILATYAQLSNASDNKQRLNTNCTDNFVHFKAVDTNSHLLSQKYFVYSNLMGRLNNQMLTLISALYWSSYLKRVLVFPGWNEHTLEDGQTLSVANVPFQKYYDLDYFLENHPNYIYIDDYNYFVLPKLRQQDVKYRTDIQNSRYGKNFFKRTWLKFTLRKEAATHLQVGVPHRWGVPETEYLKIITYFKPAQNLLSKADNWMRTHLVKPYASIHLRRWEGACKMPATEITGIIDSKLNANDTKSVFLASDGQDIHLQNMLVRKYKAVTFDEPLVEYGMYAKGIVDGYILASSKQFFANKHSNLSRYWYKYHYGLCKNKYNMSGCSPGKKSLMCLDQERVNTICSDSFEVVIMSPKDSSSFC